MNNFVRLILFTTVIICGDSSCAVGGDIQGKWIQETKTRGGLGGIFLFDEDGTITSYFGAIIENEYVVDGNTLYEKSLSQGEENQYQYIVEDDRLALKRKSDNGEIVDDKGMTMHRLDKNVKDKSSIIGKWIYDNPNGKKALVEYTKSGKSLFFIPLVHETGTFELEEGILRVNLQGKDTYIRKIKIDGNKLFLLKTDNKKEEVYIKFDD